MNCKIIDTLFFPSIENGKKLNEFLKLTKNYINICIFSLTSNDITNTLIELYNNGIKINIITDDKQSKCNGSDIEQLKKYANIKCDNKSYVYMHNKYAVIDDNIIITGSFNWSDHAIKSNYENLIIIESEELANKYNENFNMLWNKF